ncbi:TPA: hypothetical protein JG809_003270 [Vibrio parahaemolyticus]|uniref:hypothetical protein n=1 Tax=Vibrio parahaemolyticus TaxID=670 RepID=UPI00036A2D83|nr:hypothetical protein [Vibrio parahaemolyticus]EJA7341234.1 hypothetical protein [Vibrio parahaemolyticus]MBY3750896.1 hypothetical protein [Vibrio parahaemolyticus]MBY3757811.1 hypothetical protein [Vibrio parahaemolyticus]MBY3763761.1 hypothetical protein [Vibrio parahaemolyticus]MBY3774114.1 hypothetical protein [Vibrio parahaemolyticus]
MENHTISEVIGIVSSLVATALFICFSEFFRKVVLPWYEDKIYRGVRVDGVWKLVEIEDQNIESSDIKMRLELCQHGDKVTGLYYHTDGDRKYEYDVTGRISGMYLLATAAPRSNRQIDAVSFLFHLETKNSCLRMSGAALNQGNPGEVKCNDGLLFVWSE